MDETTFGEMLGWMQTFFTELGIWDDITVALSLTILFATSAAFISFVRGR